MYFSHSKYVSFYGWRHHKPLSHDFFHKLLRPLLHFYNNHSQGDGIPDLATTRHVVEVLREVGFEVLESEDLAHESEIPWYTPLDGSFNLTNLVSEKKEKKELMFYSLIFILFRE
jgi:hypothetical protein